MIKFLQLKHILSEFKERISEKSFTNQIENHELNIHWQISKKKDMQTYISNLESGIQFIERQINHINKSISEQSLRKKIEYTAQKQELLKKASHYFIELYYIDHNIDYLKKHLDVVKFHSGCLSDSYLSGLCLYTQITRDYRELVLLNSLMTKSHQSQLQKQVAIILFMQTKDEQYYEDYLQNKASITNQNLEIQFHIFAAHQFEQIGCHHSKAYHFELSEKLQKEYQRSSSDSNYLQLSSISNH